MSDENKPTAGDPSVAAAPGDPNAGKTPNEPDLSPPADMKDQRRWSELVGLVKAKDQEIAVLKGKASPPAPAAPAIAPSSRDEEIDLLLLSNQLPAELKDKATEIQALKKSNPTLTTQAAIQMWVGSQVMSSPGNAPSITNRPLNFPTQQPKFAKDLPDKDLEAAARAEVEARWGRP